MSLNSMFPAPVAPRAPAPLPYMSVAGLSIGFNTPDGARSRFVDGVEVSQSLPPYAKRNVFEVDVFADHAPSDWQKSGNSADGTPIASYFAGVKAGQGMWFDFNPCANDAHHIAIVPSVQGVNSVTGKAASLDMQQYLTECPVHKTSFAAARLCTECGYKWPKQNYVATTGTPRGSFWLDGFRQQDGKVRQWLFTEDALRGVATHVLGDARGYAIAFAIYRSMAPKPPQRLIRMGASEESLSFGFQTKGVMRSMSARSLEVGAGALINQFVYDDPNDLSFWNPKPVGIIMLSYAPDEVVNEILKHGGLTLNEGPLKGMPVGNP